MPTQTRGPVYDKEDQDNPKYENPDIGRAKPDTHEFALPGHEGASGAATPSELEDTENSGFYSPDEDGSKRPSPRSIRDKEEAGNGRVSRGDSGGSNGGGGMYNAEGENPQAGLLGQAAGKYRNARGRLNNLKRKALKNKWLVGFGAGGIGGIIFLLVILFLFAGSLKIPDFVEHVTAYQFNRVVNEYANSAEKVTEEELAIQSADKSTYEQVKGKYQNLRDNTWGKLDAFRPGIVIKNLEADNNLKIITRPSGILGRQQLTGITIDNQTYLIKQVSGPWKYVPGLKNILQLKNQYDFSNTVFPRLNAGMELDNTGTLVRGIVENNIRKAAGISLVAFLPQKFNGEKPDQALLTEERGAYDAITLEKQASQIPKTTDLREATLRAQQQVQSDVANDSTLQKILNKGGVDPNVSAILQKSFSSDTLTNILGYVNPAIGVGMPLCLVYDGSLEKSGPTIDEQTKQEQRAYYYGASAASQQKTGSPAASAEAIGALNTKFGDITQSNAEIRASGGNPTTLNTLSTEASSGGQYTILDAILPGTFLPGVLNFAADNVCPVLTNTPGVILVSLASLLAALATGGTSAGAEEAATTGADSIIGSIASNIFSRFGFEQTAKATGKIGDILTGTAKTGAKIAGATILAKMIVAADANYTHNGLEQNTDFTNESDAGANFTANQLDQQLNYGRPLACDEVNAGNQQSKQSLVDATKSQSFYERYADIRNPDSLTNHLAITASAYIKPSLATRLAGWSSYILRPLQSTASLLSSSNHGLAYAAGNCANADSTTYGQVQFGWPQSEENIINSDQSYQYLENKAALDNSGQEDNIAAEYGKCFTDSIGVLLSGSDNGSSPEIVRDNHGNVLDKGLCSPTNLGPNNPQYHDLVFRWRLDKRYSNAVDQMTCEQTITSTPCGSSDTSSSSTGGTAVPVSTTSTNTGSLPSGSAQDLAKQLLPYIQQGKLFCGAAAGGTQSSSCSDIQNTATGQPVGGNCQVKAITPHLLGLILGLEQEGWTLGISAMCSDHHVEGDGPYAGHSYGSAADFSIQEKDGKRSSGATAAADEPFVNAVAALLSQAGGSFGQVGNCHPIYPSQQSSNFTTFTDGCTHQHIRAAS